MSLLTVRHAAQRLGVGYSTDRLHAPSTQSVKSTEVMISRETAVRAPRPAAARRRR